MQVNMQNLFDIIQFYNHNQPLKPISIKLNQPLYSEKLPSEIQQLYDFIFNDQGTEVKLDKILPFVIKKTETPVCNKILDEHQPVFRCFQCTQHPAAVFCLKCFENGQHSNHRYTKIAAGGGNCDCGNPQAIKKQGFCKNHTGTTILPEIPEKQQKLFIKYFTYLFQWFSKLVQSAPKLKANTMAEIMVSYLLKLNQQSLYYNIMTYHLLFQPLPNKIKIIDYLFTLKTIEHTYSIKLFNKLYFGMFGLDQFKLELTKSFIRAYNQIDHFQKTEYHSLYIQLFANEKIVLDLCKDNKMILNPLKRKYDLQTILTDLHFVVSIKKQASIAYFKQYFAENSVIPLTFLDQIQKKLEKNDPELHLVDLVTNYLNQQNLYIIIMQEIISLFAQQKQIQLISKIFKNTYQFINNSRTSMNNQLSKMYSYKKNKVIIPYHRIFAVLLFQYYDGNICGLINKKQNVRLEKMYQILGTNSNIFVNNMKIYCVMAMNTLYQFAETYAKRNYFENYLPLYLTSGKTIINFDFLLLKQCFAYFQNIITENLEKNQSVSTMVIASQLISQFFKQKKQKLAQNAQKLEIANQEFLQTWITFLSLIMQSIISHVPEIVTNQGLQMKNNKEIYGYRRQIFEGLLKLHGPITREEIKPLEKQFLGKLTDQVIQDMSIFNKSTRKYCIPEHNKIQPLDLRYYPSKLKTQVNRLGKVSQLPHIMPPNINNLQIESIISVFDKNILQALLQEIQSKNKAVQNLQLICRDYQNFLERLSNLIVKKIKQNVVQMQDQGVSAKNSKIWIQYKCVISEILEKLKFLQSSFTDYGVNNKDKLQEEKKKQLAEKSRLKKQKLLKKYHQKNVKILEENQALISHVENQEKEIQDKIMKSQLDDTDQKLCMICRDPSQKDSLCYLAYIQSTNRLNYRLKIPENLYFFKSCMHAAHYKCCYKMFGKKQIFKCPLCKTQSNIMLPVPGMSDRQSQHQMINRVDFIIQTQNSTPQFLTSKFPKVDNINVFWILLKSFSQIIGTNGLLNSQLFQKSQKRIASCLYKLLKSYWNDQLKLDDQICLQNIIMQYVQYHRDWLKNGKEGVTNNDQMLICQIKLCCISVIFQSLVHQFVPQYVYDRYGLSIGTKDLKQLTKNLCLTISPNKQFNLSQIQQTQSQVKPLLSAFQAYFKPPLTCPDFFEFRKQNAKFCKNGHNIIICVQCQQHYCYDCKESLKHVKQTHANNALFFSCLNGSLIHLSINKSLRIPSLYQNKIGNYWTAQKSTETFILNQQLYIEIVNQYFKNNIYNFLSSRFNKLLEISRQNMAFNEPFH